MTRSQLLEGEESTLGLDADEWGAQWADSKAPAAELPAPPAPRPERVPPDRTVTDRTVTDRTVRERAATVPPPPPTTARSVFDGSAPELETGPSSNQPPISGYQDFAGSNFPSGSPARKIMMVLVISLVGAVVVFFQSRNEEFAIDATEVEVTTTVPVTTAPPAAPSANAADQADTADALGLASSSELLERALGSEADAGRARAVEPPAAPTTEAPTTTEAPATTAAPATTEAPATTTPSSTEAADTTVADGTGGTDSSTETTVAQDAGTEDSVAEDTVADDTTTTTEAPAESTTTSAAPAGEAGWVDTGNGVLVPPVLLQIRFCESTDNYTAANPSSSARGAYQFLTGSWDAYGHKDRYGVSQAHLASPAQQDEAALLTWQRDGTRPWNASRHCWG